MEYLSLSQTKQIAGRAGRFGVETDGVAGGNVTTLHHQDLPFLREAMTSENPPVLRASLAVPLSTIETVRSSLPAGSGFAQVHAAVDLLTVPGEIYTPKYYVHAAEIVKTMDVIGKNSPLTDVQTFIDAPFQLRDEATKGPQILLAKMYFDTLTVDLEDFLQKSGLVAALDESRLLAGRLRLRTQQISGTTDSTTSPPQNIDADQQAEIHHLVTALEPLHRTIVLYLWLSFRRPLSFLDQELAYTLKAEVEGLIDFLLTCLSSEKKKSADAAEAKVLEEAAVLPFEWKYDARAEEDDQSRRTATYSLPY